MDEVLNPKPVEADPAEENPADAVAPVLPDELIKGDWSRRLVLPNQDGQLRLTPVRTVREALRGPRTRFGISTTNGATALER